VQRSGDHFEKEPGLKPSCDFACFPFIVEAGKGYSKLRQTLCILGVLPYLFSYVLETEFSAMLELRTLGLLHLMCTMKPGKSGVCQTLQMFVAAGRLIKLTEIYAQSSYETRPVLTPLILQIVRTIFVSRFSTRKLCFARIFAGARFLKCFRGDMSSSLTGSGCSRFDETTANAGAGV
jgi:hypothetical protein